MFSLLICVVLVVLVITLGMGSGSGSKIRIVVVVVVVVAIVVVVVAAFTFETATAFSLKLPDSKLVSRLDSKRFAVFRSLPGKHHKFYEMQICHTVSESTKNSMQRVLFMRVNQSVRKRCTICAFPALIGNVAQHHTMYHACAFSSKA